ncbi:ATPase, T2SS/T4P/T4SS family [Thermofilum sp.]|jgi:pilus assembly protein CpaF|uniref:ATPase, T2SS/T4P/T4SS family n=1 Tax=Thermofilum sp. TaxID=1961369 RepID=UPI0025872892|nr:ATPase, T2SS/T4P/T4SS family [Thermofilum sp.]
MSGGFLRAKLDKKYIERLLAEEAKKEEQSVATASAEIGSEQLELPAAPEPATQKKRLSLPKLGFRVPRIARPEIRAPKLRLPRAKVKKSKLEGMETPELMWPGLENAKPVRVETGTIYIGDGVLAVYPRVEDNAPFGPLQPLVELRELQELFVSEADGSVNIMATIGGKRYKVLLPRQLLVDLLAQRIAIESGIPLNERNPQDSGEYHGFRVNITMPQLSGGWQISMARLSMPENVKYDPLLTARILTLLARPMSGLIFGPPGSGKTTLLTHLLNTFAELFPAAIISIVEEEAELSLHVRGNVRKYFSFQRSVTDNIRATRRYDRPDLLVVGELRGEEVVSWFEAAGSGIPVISTVHASTLSDALKRLDTIIQSANIRGSIKDAVYLYIEAGKIMTHEGIQRGVQAVYIYDGEGFEILYKAGLHTSEEEFMKYLPPKLQFSFHGEGAEETYKEIKRRLGVDMDKYKLAPLGRVTLDELLIQSAE